MFVDLFFCRWLGYLGLLLFDVLICLLVLFGLIRNSRGTLIGYVMLHHSTKAAPIRRIEFLLHIGEPNLHIKELFLFVLQCVSVGGFDSHHQLGVSRFGTGCRCCKCYHGNMAELLGSAMM